MPNHGQNSGDNGCRKEDFVHHVGLLRVDCHVVVVGIAVGDGVELEQVKNEDDRRCRMALPEAISVSMSERGKNEF